MVEAIAKAITKVETNNLRTKTKELIKLFILINFCG